MSRRDHGPYATLFFAEFDARERTFRYVNAGHNPPLLILPNGEGILELSHGGPPTGLFRDASYDYGEQVLRPESTVLIYTDGVVESRNARDEEFGVERLTALCRAHSREDPDGLITTVLDEVRDLEHWPGAARRCHSVRPEDYYLRAALPLYFCTS